MFIGHYGLGFALNKKFSKIKLWEFFLAVQLLDFIAFILIIIGLERAHYIENTNPFFRNDIYLPFSHSLSGAIIISAIVYFIYKKIRDNKIALVIALAVLSHWFIDVIVHNSDITLFFGYGNVGFGLWNYPQVSFYLEIILVLMGWFYLGKKTLFSYLLVLLMIAGFAGMIFRPEPEIIKESVLLRSGIVLISNGIFVILSGKV